MNGFWAMFHGDGDGPASILASASGHFVHSRQPTIVNYERDDPTAAQAGLIFWRNTFISWQRHFIAAVLLDTYFHPRAVFHSNTFSFPHTFSPTKGKPYHLKR
jgi:hypothetical protein